MNKRGASVYHRVSRERLSLDYVYHRYFVEGITNSYGEVRKNGGPQLAEGAAGEVRQGPELRAFVLKPGYLED